MSWTGWDDEPSGGASSKRSRSERDTWGAARDEEPIDWDSAILASEAATRAKWAALPPIARDFYHEDPAVANASDEDVAAFREASNNITVSHFNEEDTRKIPNPVRAFKHAFSKFPEIMKEIEKQGFETPSPIQSQSWPVLLKGMDLIGIAQTGTGKTLAYLLPALIHIDAQTTPRHERVGPTALILAPTRELAQQIERETQKISYRGIKSVCIYGGGSRSDQVNIVERGVEIVIATPGRLSDLCCARIIDLTSVSYMVLDEADRMLDMGFEPQISKIMLDIRPDRQTVMMSATWPENVRSLALKYMNAPLQTYIGTLDLAAVDSVTQEIILIDPTRKREFIESWISRMGPTHKVIVFVGKKAMVDDISSDFALKGIDCQCLHGSRDQRDREQALEDMKTGRTKILIATDVAARGLDIVDLTHIINMDFPRNIEEYVHRVGRTGRAGKTGSAITLVSREDSRHVKELIEILERAKQHVPNGLREQAARFEIYKEKRDSEQAERRGRGGGGGGGGRGCFKCGEEGHMSRECPSGRSGFGGAPDGRSCFKCGQPGHISRDCRQKQEDGYGGDRGPGSRGSQLGAGGFGRARGYDRQPVNSSSESYTPNKTQQDSWTPHPAPQIQTPRIYSPAARTRPQDDADDGW